MSIIYLCIVCSAYAASKWSANLIIILLLALFAAAPAAAMLITTIVPLASIYALLQSHKLDFNIKVLNLI